MFLGFFFFLSLHLRKCINRKTLLTIVSDFRYQKTVESAVVTSLLRGAFKTQLAEPRLRSPQTQTVDWPIAKVSATQTALTDTEMWQRMFRINLFFYGGQYLFSYTLSSFYDKPADVKSLFCFIFFFLIQRRAHDTHSVDPFSLFDSVNAY